MSGSKIWQASMPSNIALIKYMGKKNVEQNIPSNSSISWTLDHLTSRVEVQICQGQDQWELAPSDYPFEMSAKGKEKFLKHAKRVKEYFSVKESFLIRSANNFPADCGIASSASSFAALTEALCIACSELSGKSIEDSEKALLSSKGSGSSCRSFWSGLVIWAESAIGPMDSQLSDLSHMVILVGKGAKAVGSSEAHKRIASSSLNRNRGERAEARLRDILENINPVDWKKLYQTIWAEFYDMHALFETSTPSFGYFLPDTVRVLSDVREHWEKTGDGPLVTMDAGPNIHLLWRSNQTEQAINYFKNSIQSRWDCLSDIKDIGFAKV